MANQLTKPVFLLFTLSKKGIKGSLYNLLFILYYYFFYQVLDHFNTGNRFNFDTPIALFILAIFVLEHWAARYKIGYEALIRKTDSKLGCATGIGALFIAIFRAVIRMAVIGYVIEALFSHHYRDMLLLLSFFLIIGKEFFIFKYLNKAPSIRWNRIRLFIADFILINMLAMMTFVVDVFLFKDKLQENIHHTSQTNLIIGCIVISITYGLFFLLPNRIIEFYSEWIDLETKTQKFFYILSYIFLVASIAFL